MTDSPTVPHRTGRIPAIDAARGIALLAMASFHLMWDLEFFGYLPAGTTSHGFVKVYARGIASSFLFLVGLSLALAHARGIRWVMFRRRMAALVAAAALISLGTFLAIRNEWIFFGILHHIAVASLIGLLFLRVPALLTALVAVAVIALPFFVRSPFFDIPALWWVGLSANAPRSNDYVPLFPWFGAVLLGIAACRLGLAAGLDQRLRRGEPGRVARPLAFLGRHSLIFYLVHQPVLIGLVWLAAQVVPPMLESPQVRFRDACEASCTPQRGEAFCARYCLCMVDSLDRAGLTEPVLNNEASDEARARVKDFAGFCVGRVEIEGAEPGD